MPLASTRRIDCYTSGDRERHRNLRPSATGNRRRSRVRPPRGRERPDVLELRLRVAAQQTDPDAGAEGQGGVILSLLPAASKNNNHPDVEHRHCDAVSSCVALSSQWSLTSLARCRTSPIDPSR